MAPMRIEPEEQSWAVLAHLSGLAGYIIPLGGAIVPIILMFARSDSPAISSIAKQALMLNIFVFMLMIICFVLFFTIILIPLVWLLGMGAAFIALVFPLVGVVKSMNGEYFRYPLVGSYPRR